MTSFRDIHASYVATDAFLTTRLGTARTAKVKARRKQLQIYNAHAYFVMLFAQLEQHVDNQCMALAARKKSSTNWKSRRPWDSLDVDRMHFMRKVSLLTDKGQATYAKIDAYYDTRCKLAHGDSALVGPIPLIIVANDFQVIAKVLRAR